MSVFRVRPVRPGNGGNEEREYKKVAGKRDENIQETLRRKRGVVDSRISVAAFLFSSLFVAPKLSFLRRH